MTEPSVWTPIADALAALSAEVLELRTTRRELGEALVRVTEERDEARAQVHQLHKRGIDHVRRHHRLFDEWMTERAQLVDDRDEARDEVVRLGREREQLRSRIAVHSREATRYTKEAVRLRTIIRELGAGEAVEPEEQIEALRPGFPEEAAYWTDDADGDPGGPFRSRES